MTCVLAIQRIPPFWSYEDRCNFARHFGAIDIQVPGPEVILARFSSPDSTREALKRLHQLMVGELPPRRLLVEFVENVKLPNLEENFLPEIQTGFIERFCCRRPRLYSGEFAYPYQPPNSVVMENIVRELWTNPAFYVETLNLMRRMNLKAPFWRQNSTDDDVIPECAYRKVPYYYKATDISAEKVLKFEKLMKNCSKNKKSRPACNLAFEKVSKLEKSISININSNEEKSRENQEEIIVGEEFGKFQPTSADSTNCANTEEDFDFATTIHVEEIKKCKISTSDWKKYGNIFEKYAPNEPSCRLYVKNVSKKAKENDLKRIFGSFVNGESEEEKRGFDVRLLIRGKMHGQAFVSYSNCESATAALRETNGYLLYEKPIVVTYARSKQIKI